MNETVKCITLWQPWASLIVMGRKKIETRGWECSYRGRLLIHAAKRMDTALAFCHKPPFNKYVSLANLPYGAIVGEVQLVGMHSISSLRDRIPAIKSHHIVGDQLILTDSEEYAFGDYSLGRYGWILENPIRYANPIPYKGQQGMFNVPDYLLP